MSVLLTPIQLTKMGDRMQKRPMRPKTREFPALTCGVLDPLTIN